MRISDWSSDVCSSDLLGGEDLVDDLVGVVADGLGERDQHDGGGDDGEGGGHEVTSGVAAFMKVIQCVSADLPTRLCPTSGFSVVSASTSETGICVSFHLKIRTPSGSRTRKHSVKPEARYSRHVDARSEEHTSE